jgi:histidinol-phosphate aminotransferase
MPLIPEDALVIVDEAYREFDETQFNSRDLLLQFPNMIVTRTFSKIYGMAGFRLGYGVMRPAIVDPCTASAILSVSTVLRWPPAWRR